MPDFFFFSSGSSDFLERLLFTWQLHGDDKTSECHCLEMVWSITRVVGYLFPPIPSLLC